MSYCFADQLEHTMKQFSPFPHLQILYSHRNDGSFREFEKIEKFLAPQLSSLISFLKLEHSDQIVFISKEENTTHSGDTISTQIPKQTLTFVVADCFPVILFDSEHQAFSLVHCGWKSLVQNLLALTMLEMHNMYQTNAKDVQVWIGPGICEECYTQSYPPVQGSLPKWQSSIKEIEYKNYSINLKQFIKQELDRLGVRQESITDENQCTYMNKDQFFSHRRATNEGDEDGRFIVAAWITK